MYNAVFIIQVDMDEQSITKNVSSNIAVCNFAYM